MKWNFFYNIDAIIKGTDIQTKWDLRPSKIYESNFEWFPTIINTIQSTSSAIFCKNKRSPGNWIEIPRELIYLFESLSFFEKNYKSTNNSYGILCKRWLVFINLKLPANKIIVGYDKEKKTSTRELKKDYGIITIDNFEQ
jgi:hypothetical protein